MLETTKKSSIQFNSSNSNFILCGRLTKTKVKSLKYYPNDKIVTHKFYGSDSVKKVTTT